MLYFDLNIKSRLYIFENIKFCKINFVFTMDFNE